MNIKYVVLFAFAVASVMAARMIRREMEEELIAAKGDALDATFKKFEKEQDGDRLTDALVEMAEKEEYMPMVARCLEIANDPYPKEASRVGKFVWDTIFNIHKATRKNTEAFANVVASFKPSAVKPLALIRYLILWRHDAKDVLERVKKKSPELITGSLSKWLATHGFDRSSRGYKDYESTREQTFDYLVSLATVHDLNEALVNAKKNEHFKVNSSVYCCMPETSSPTDLIKNLKVLIIKRKEDFLGGILALPATPIKLIGEYFGDLPSETPSITTEPSAPVEPEFSGQTEHTATVGEKPSTPVQPEVNGQIEHTPTVRRVSPSNTALSRSHNQAIYRQSSQLVTAFMVLILVVLLSKFLTR